MGRRLVGGAHRRLFRSNCAAGMLPALCWQWPGIPCFLTCPSFCLAPSGTKWVGSAQIQLEPNLALCLCLSAHTHTMPCHTASAHCAENTVSCTVEISRKFAQPWHGLGGVCQCKAGRRSTAAAACLALPLKAAICCCGCHSKVKRCLPTSHVSQLVYVMVIQLSLVTPAATCLKLVAGATGGFMCSVCEQDLCIRLCVYASTHHHCLQLQFMVTGICGLCQVHFSS